MSVQIILWRHADAEDPGPAGDLARNLTRKGHKQAERMAAWLRPRLEGDWKILCSPAARALQTVEPLGLEFETRPGLAPGREATTLLREAGWPGGGPVVVVGHQPTLGEAAAILLGGGAAEVSFRKGAIWWFAARERDGRLETVLKAVMEPEMIEAP
jgi:phosphohistidine phosphatase